jgi:hypothetical protein
MRSCRSAVWGCRPGWRRSTNYWAIRASLFRSSRSSIPGGAAVDPIETDLMFLRYGYRLGFETLCAEVAASITWRRFYRVPLDTAVLHPTTLFKITSRRRSTAVGALNEALLAKAAEKKLARLEKVRIDSTVVESNVAYSTDSWPGASPPWSGWWRC